MQQQSVRELTPQEIADGVRGINDKDLTATEIQALVRAMDDSKKMWRHLPKDAYLAKLREENGVLYFNYPSLWNMHSEDRLDTTFFEMLALKRRIEKGELTADQATAIMGKKLFDTYVPQSETPNKTKAMKYEDFYKQM
jgi:hypothetical protein